MTIRVDTGPSNPMEDCHGADVNSDGRVDFCDTALLSEHGLEDCGVTNCEDSNIDSSDHGANFGDFSAVAENSPTHGFSVRICRL